MQVALIGASGFVGAAVLKELLARGHRVVALVREPSKLAEQPNVRVVQGDVRDPQQVANAVRDTDAVLSAYNAGWANPNLYEDFLQGARAITEGVRQVQYAGKPRLVVVGGAGSLFVAPDVQLVDTPDFPVAIRPGAAAARDWLRSLQQEKHLNWSFLSPPIGFHPGGVSGRTGQYRVGQDAPLMQADGSPAGISPEDLAMALVDELETPRHLRSRFTVAH